jgi:tRNA(Ile)-lysidine synthase
MHDDAIALLPRPPDSATASIVVGFSGGLDSTVLLHVLASDSVLRTQGVRALHIDHGLHTDSQDWAAQAQGIADALGVGFRKIAVQVPRDRGLGPEAAARQARRTAFAAELRAGEVLALAQHRDDQAETFLLRALRASGPDGLGSIRPWRAFAAGWLWRPLLDTPRSDLLAYAQRHGLRWIEDPSNHEVALDRNFLRHRILPLLRERWPHADAALARSAELSTQASDLLDDEDAAALQRMRLDGGDALSRQALRTLAPERRARVLRRWVRDCGAPPLTGEGLARIESDLLPAARDRLPAFAWHGRDIVAWRDGLYCIEDRKSAARALPQHTSLPWDGRAPLTLANGDRLVLLDADALPWPVRVHARRGGERIRLPQREHHHALKHVLQDLDIPPWERARMPLLSRADGALIAAGDRIVSAEFNEWLQVSGAELRWLRADAAVAHRDQ